MHNRTPSLVMVAFAFALFVPALGYLYLGPLYAILFATGYLGGFAFWIVAPQGASWLAIRGPYLLTMAAFLLLHKVEENRTASFEAVSTRITHLPTPEVSFGLLIAFPWARGWPSRFLRGATGNSFASSHGPSSHRWD